MIGIMAAVTTLVMAARALDFWIGSIVGLSGVVVAALADAWPWPVAVAAALLAGMACGVLNDLIVSRLRIEALIVTDLPRIFLHLELGSGP